MTAPLHDLLEDLAASQRLDAPALGERTWAGGRIRRRRRAALTATGAGAAALVVLLVLAPLLTGTRTPLTGQSFARTSGQAVEGRPERIERQWWVRELPDRPGPVAALLQAVEEQQSWDEPDGWYAVAADGHRWRLPGDAYEFQPALSADGRRLGALLADDGPYVVHDLVTGERTVFEDVGGQVGGAAATTHRIAAQHPASWSPDGRWIAVQGERDVLLLDAVAGTVATVPRTGPLVGFAGPDRLAWFVDERDPTAAGPGEVVQGRVALVVTDLRGTRLRDVELRPAAGPVPFLHQWSGELSSDGAGLVITDDELVRRFSAADGTESAVPVRLPSAPACGTAVGETTGTTVVQTLTAEGELVAQRVDASSTRPQTVVADSVAGRCLVWAAGALDAPARGGRPAWPALLLASGAAAVGLLVLRRVRR